MSVSALQLVQHANLTLPGDLFITGIGWVNWPEKAAGIFSAVDTDFNPSDITLAVILLTILLVS